MSSGDVGRRDRLAVGPGAALVFVYGILALAASARSAVQISRDFSAAPLAFSLSAFAALVYVVATVALAARGRVWRRVAVVSMSIELVGVVLVGALSLVLPALQATPFGGDATVWSWFGAGYGFVPLVLPILGLLWVRRAGRVSGR